MTTQSRSRRQARGGQSLVEFAIVLPLMLLLVGGAYTMWTGLHSAIGVTSAARAGALTAANQLATTKVQPATGPGAPYTWAQLNAVLVSAVASVSAEDGVVTYHPGPCAVGVEPCRPTPCAVGQACVSITSTNVPTDNGTYLPVVTVSVSQSIAPQVPVMTQYTLRASAECPAPGSS
jgi:Flp pilus assembly protein TadG